MKSTIKLSIVVMLALTNISFAIDQDENDWAEILSGVKDDQTGEQGFLYDTNEARSGSLYAARVNYQFQGGDGNGDFSSNEAVKMTVTTPSGEKIETGRYMTPKELSSWADEHADQLLKAVFGSDPSATVSGTTTSVAQASNEIVHQTASSKQRRKVTKSKKGVKAKSFETNFSSLVVMDSEKASMSSNGISGTSSAFKFSYDKELKNGNDVGALFSYRKTKASDVYGSTSSSILLSPYYKYYHTINDKVEVVGVGNLLINKREMDSSLFKDFAYLEYGMGLAAIPSYYVNDQLSFSMPLGIQTIKKKITSSVPDSIDFIVNAINNLSFQTSINYGLGVEYAIKDNWYANLDVLQTKEVGSDTSYGKDAITYYSLRTTYYGEYWNYALGYKTVKNVLNYDEDAYMVSVQYNW